MAPGRAPSREHADAVHAARPGAADSQLRDAIVDQCRRRLYQQHLSSSGADGQVSAVVRQVLADRGDDPDGALAAQVIASLIGWGPVQSLLDRPEVEELWWNDPARVYVSVAGSTSLSNVVMSDREAEEIVARAVTAAGRRLDTTRPFVDAELADGSRLHVVIPPVTRRHWAVNIRRYVLRPSGLSDLTRTGTLTQESAALLDRAIRAGAGVVVSGGTHTGKTTMLNALLCSAPTTRVVTCEEVRELRLPLGDWVALQTREAGIEGTAAVSLRDLVREALRMRPGRLVVGEVRGPEALDLLLAMNCGIPAAATIHANSAQDVIDRLTGLPLLAGANVSVDFVTRTLASCLDLVVHLDNRDGIRRVAQIASVRPGPGGPVLARLFADDGSGLKRGAGEIPVEWTLA